MSNARVLVVDDSITMRALFSDVLERSKNVEVVGAAADADEARDMIAELRPNVLTLDVEMPGMNGLEFLAELMEHQPMPVVMLSTLTQKGASTSLQAFELGAVDCFPKPQKATPDEFDKIAGKLGKLVHAAANGKVSSKKAEPDQVTAQVDFEWNGKLLAMSGSTGGIDAVSQILASFPANCPPTIILLRIEEGFVEPFAAKLAETTKPNIKIAADGMALEQGCVYIAADPRAHVVVDRWPEGCIRFMEKDAVQGFRPSASLLFASMGKAGANTVGTILTGMGEDGVSGLKALKASGGHAIAQDPETAMVSDAPAAAIAANVIDDKASLDGMAKAVLAACGAVS